MILSNVKLTTVLGAALVAAMPVVSSGRAAAAPPPGLRWSDQAFRSGGTPTSGAVSSFAPRSYSYPQSYGYTPAYYPPVAPAVAAAAPVAPGTTAVAPGTSASQETIAIRGPDGVVRSFPVQGGAVQQQVALPGQGAQSFVSVTGSDGVVRYYPAASPPAVPGPVIASPYQPVYVMPPCR